MLERIPERIVAVTALPPFLFLNLQMLLKTSYREFYRVQGFSEIIHLKKNIKI